MTIEEIYVALLDEGVDVWRPAPAHQIGAQTYVILRPDDYDADDETWEFPPGTIVRCATRKITDGDILAAIERVELSDRKSA